METFILFYVSWHEREITLSEMREFIVEEMGEDGLVEVLKEFKSKRLEREAAGYAGTFYEFIKA